MTRSDIISLAVAFLCYAIGAVYYRRKAIRIGYDSVGFATWLWPTICCYEVVLLVSGQGLPGEEP